MKSLKLILLVILVFGMQVAFSAPAPPPSTSAATGGPGCWPPPCVPIDSGIVFLMVAAALYGAYKLVAHRKSEQTIS